MMNLKVLLPFKVYMEISNISHIVVETGNGVYGFLPQRLDCVAALIPGILTYKVGKADIQYIAVDEGILVKAGKHVLVSVRNAIGGASLGKLRETVELEFEKLDESEKNMRVAIAKLENGFIYSLEKFRK
jgi:F-type H+-transporting ATPase subunit epsilon